jgi:hypothetical protein
MRFGRRNILTDLPTQYGVIPLDAKQVEKALWVDAPASGKNLCNRKVSMIEIP